MDRSRRFGIAEWGAWLFLLLSPMLYAAGPLTRYFDLPADTAEKTLKQFSEQAGNEVLFATRLAKAVRTQAVKGQMTAREAIDRMLVGTGLVVHQDEKTGAFSVRRPTDAEKNAKRSSPNRAGALRDPRSENEDDKPAGTSSDGKSSAKKKTKL